MADKSFSVQVKGIRQLAKAFKQVNDELPDEMKHALMGIASRVAASARARVPTLSGKAAASIKPKATARGASIAEGGSSAPYMGWLDFGGRWKRHGADSHNPRPWMGKPGGEGRYLYPAVSEARAATHAALGEVLERLAEKAELEQRGSIE